MTRIDFNKPAQEVANDLIGTTIQVGVNGPEYQIAETKAWSAEENQNPLYRTVYAAKWGYWTVVPVNAQPVLIFTTEAGSCVQIKRLERNGELLAIKRVLSAKKVTPRKIRFAQGKIIISAQE